MRLFFMVCADLDGRIVMRPYTRDPHWCVGAIHESPVMICGNPFRGVEDAAPYVKIRPSQNVTAGADSISARGTGNPSPTHTIEV